MTAESMGHHMPHLTLPKLGILFRKKTGAASVVAIAPVAEPGTSRKARRPTLQEISREMVQRRENSFKGALAGTAIFAAAIAAAAMIANAQGPETPQQGRAIYTQYGGEVIQPAASAPANTPS
ncbi:MAG: hypothetical protein P4M15_05955 [Alphaproteobacteria bacterium]|nr:hypothetical protein [Alphaproteobacteria bacterium]